MAERHTVSQGECIDSIALEHGFFAETIWLHPDNEELKALRKDPNVLQPGDVVVIPDLRPRTEARATEGTHRFKRKGVPGLVKLRFLRPKPQEDADDESAEGDEDVSVYEEPELSGQPQEMEPIADAPYRLKLGTSTFEGSSDSEGIVEHAIPPDIEEGEITFNLGGEDEITFPLAFGQMDPVSTIVGARKRLHNLGYQCTMEEDEITPELREVIGAFQNDNDLEVNGELDDATKDKLLEVHGI